MKNSLLLNQFVFKFLKMVDLGTDFYSNFFDCLSDLSDWEKEEESSFLTLNPVIVENQLGTKELIESMQKGSEEKIKNFCNISPNGIYHINCNDRIFFGPWFNQDVMESYYSICNYVKDYKIFVNYFEKVYVPVLYQRIKKNDPFRWERKIWKQIVYKNIPSQLRNIFGQQKDNEFFCFKFRGKEKNCIEIKKLICQLNIPKDLIKIIESYIPLNPKQFVVDFRVNFYIYENDKTYCPGNIKIIKTDHNNNKNRESKESWQCFFAYYFGVEGNTL